MKGVHRHCPLHALYGGQQIMHPENYDIEGTLLRTFSSIWALLVYDSPPWHGWGYFICGVLIPLTYQHVDTSRLWRTPDPAPWRAQPVCGWPWPWPRDRCCYVGSVPWRWCWLVSSYTSAEGRTSRTDLPIILNNCIEFNSWLFALHRKIEVHRGATILGTLQGWSSFTISMDFCTPIMQFWMNPRQIGCTDLGGCPRSTRIIDTRSFLSLQLLMFFITIMQPKGNHYYFWKLTLTVVKLARNLPICFSKKKKKKKKKKKRTDSNSLTELSPSQPFNHFHVSHIFMLTKFPDFLLFSFHFPVFFQCFP